MPAMANGAALSRPEADHPEQHPGADATRRRLACEAPTAPREQRKDDEEDDVRGDVVPAKEAFEVLGLVEQGRVEDLLLVDRRQLEVVGDGCRPEQVGSQEPESDRRERKREPSQAGSSTGVGASSGSGSGSG